MSIICTCGHKVFSGNDCIPVEYDDYESIDFDGPEPVFSPCKVLATYCPECAARGAAAGHLRIIQ